MANVTYLIGAGASAGKRDEKGRVLEGLPCVNEISDRLLTLIRNIENYQVTNQLYNYRLDLLDKLKNLYSMSSRHATIDTYAKKLKLKQDDSQFYQVEMLLAFFLLVEQLLHKPDSRYDTFYASVLNSDLEIPSNINIISWNYDSQFEIAYKEYGANKTLPIFSKFDNQKTTPQKIFKVNGTALFNNISNITTLRDEMPQLEKDFHGREILSNQGVVYIVDLYKKAFQPMGSKNTLLSFAFDDGDNSEMFDQIDNIIHRTDALVIIGYTFPFFNREVDRRILHYLNANAKIYIQDINTEYVRQSLEAVLSKEQRRTEIIEIKRTEQLYLPPEL